MQHKTDLVATIAGLGLLFARSSPLSCNVGLSLIGYAFTSVLTPVLAPHFIRIGLHGKDISKKGRPLLAESLGAVACLIYLCCLLLFVPFVFYKYFVTVTSGGGARDTGLEETNGERHLFPHQKLSEYLSALLCLQSMLILGMADDLFDIRWRNKVLLPAVAAVPLLIVYYVDFGVTKVVVPPFVQQLFGAKPYVDLGILYYGYMAAIAIFCPNAVNILAGVNGLEVGQCVVMALCILLNDMLYIFGSSGPAVDTHLLSAYLLIPLLGVSLGLLKHNWFPARVFVGDTYCYFAGMVFAVVGILGHFSKTLLLFFVPQVFNFLYSAPQLFHLIECPRHRLPKFNETTGLLEPSRATIKSPSKLVKILITLLSKLGLIGLWVQKDGSWQVSNMTLMNLVLVRLGPMREDYLTIVMLTIQAIMGIFGVFLRHTVAALLFGRDNY